MAAQAQTREDRAEKITAVLQRLGLKDAAAGSGTGCWALWVDRTLSASRRDPSDALDGDGL